MRLIDADALDMQNWENVNDAVTNIKQAPTIDAVVLPCPIGSDSWWVNPETKEVLCEKGGITGFAIRKEEILALDSYGEPVKLHTEWYSLSKEDAEAFKEKMMG